MIVCTLYNCTLTSNSVVYIGGGGGAWQSTLNNCTLTGNSGSGAVSSSLNNCVVYYNDENYDSSSIP